MQKFLAKEKKKKEFSDELRVQNDKLRSNLTEHSVKIMFKNNLKYFKKIEMGLQKSWRHKMFHDSRNKARNDRTLYENMIAAPFSTIQQELIYREVKQVWLPNNEMQLKNNRYVELVLLPEVFLALYQKFFYLPTIEIAESRIKDPGSLAPEDISPESSMNKPRC